MTPETQPKDKLTKQMAFDNNFTALDCVKYYWPEIKNEDADYILWEETCFPFDVDMMLTHLYNKYLDNPNLTDFNNQKQVNP